MKRKSLVVRIFFCGSFLCSAAAFAGGNYNCVQTDTLPSQKAAATADSAKAEAQAATKKPAAAVTVAKAAKATAQKAAKDADAAKKAAAAKATLLKKVVAWLSFKKNIQKKRKEEILEMVSEMNFPDTMKAMSLQLQAMIDTVSDKQNESYTKLMDEINGLYLLMKQQDSIASVPYETLVKKEPGLASDATDNPALKIIPSQISEDGKSEGNPGKYKVLSLIKQVADEQYHFQAGVDTGRRWKLTKKVDICAYYNANASFDYSRTDFHFISTLIYDSLFAITRSGQLRKLKNWRNNGLIDSARNAGCRIIYTISPGSGVSADELLSDNNVKDNFAAAVLALQNSDQANGININFGNLSSYNRDFFTQFISYFSTLCRQSSPAFKIYITVPVYDEQSAYDIKSLAPFVERFCINFSAGRPDQPVPSAPLSGKAQTTIESSLAYYLNQQAVPAKFMINIGYRGTKWLIYVKGKRPNPSRFIQYMTYESIRNKTYANVLYDSLSHSAFIDTAYADGNVITRIWFDDENTLGDKYDYVLETGLGGVGFGYLGYDGTYGELWNELLYKFIQVDSIPPVIIAKDSLGFFERLRMRYALYDYILDHPCEVCFDNDSTVNLNQYIVDLGIDNDVKVRNDSLARDTTNGKVKGVTSFIYQHYTKEQGDKWRYKKSVGWAMVILSVLFTWSIFDYLFTSNWMPDFGVSDNNTDDIAAAAKPDQNCVNMPLATLLGIIVIASVIGNCAFPRSFLTCPV